MKNKLTKISVVLFVLAFIALSQTAVFAAPATFQIINNNAPGVGLNDPTPAAPVGGNPGTTLGDQRMNVLLEVARIWSARLDSNVPIRIRAQFVPLGTGVLGSTSTGTFSRDFAGATFAGTWHHAALANKLAGVDLVPAGNSLGLPEYDMNVSFSSTFNFYLGFDGNHGAAFDLVAVLLHEYAHGLGFSQTASLVNGALFSGFPDVYNRHLFDLTNGLNWPAMTNAQRLASATNFGKVVWDGFFVTSNVASVLSFGSPEVQVNSPAAIAGTYQFATAAFGPPVGSPNVIGAQVVAAVDIVEPATPGPPATAAGTTTDGCSPFSNAGAVAGKIALIERGLCGFAVKARNATNAGAVGVIIYNNAANAGAAPPGMADDGINGAFVTIPTVSVRRADGLLIVGQLGVSPTASILIDPTIRAGADALNRMRVYAPFPVVSGSSISHYDTVANRNLLMEPNINGDLTHKVKAPEDLTFELLHDIGWTFPDADSDGVVDDEDCNPNSITTGTIIIGGIDTGVPNTMFQGGCFMADVLAQIAANNTGNHGSYVSAIAAQLNQWVAQGLISGKQKGAIQSAAAKYKP